MRRDMTIQDWGWICDNDNVYFKHKHNECIYLTGNKPCDSGHPYRKYGRGHVEYFILPREFFIND